MGAVSSIFCRGICAWLSIALAGSCWAQASAPLRSVPGWDIVKAPTGSCMAHRAGAQVDTIMVTNRDGKLILMAGRHDSNMPTGPRTVTLEIDEHRWEAVAATSFNSLILVLVNDPAMLEQLRHAQRLIWVLPLQRVAADLPRLGQAIDSIMVPGCGG